jgi:hypothetical protein
MGAVFPQELTLELRMRLDILKERHSWMINILNALMWSHSEYRIENLGHHVVKRSPIPKEGIKETIKQYTIQLNNIVDVGIVHVKNSLYALLEENGTPERINIWLITAK